jgi:hypothetical protein
VVSLKVASGRYTTATTWLFCVLFPGGLVIASFGAAFRPDFGELLDRYVVERGLGAIGLRFPTGLSTPEGMALTWDLLTCGGDLAPFPGLPASSPPPEPSVYRAQEEGEIALPPVRWRDEDEGLATFKLRWRPRRLELVLPDPA